MNCVRSDARRTCEAEDGGDLPWQVESLIGHGSTPVWKEKRPGCASRTFQVRWFLDAPQILRGDL